MHLHILSNHYRNTECSIIKAYAPVLDLEVGVSLDHGVSLRIVSLPTFLTLYVTFPAKNNIRSSPASFALAQVSHWSNTCTANHLRRGSSGEKMEHKGEQGVQALVEPWSDASVGTAAVGRKACLRTKQNNVEQCKNQAHTES